MKNTLILKLVVLLFLGMNTNAMMAQFGSCNLITVSQGCTVDWTAELTIGNNACSSWQILFGDGSNASGSISGAPGTTITISDQYTYQNPGTYSITFQGVCVFPIPQCFTTVTVECEGVPPCTYPAVVNTICDMLCLQVYNENGCGEYVVEYGICHSADLQTMSFPVNTVGSIDLCIPITESGNYGYNYYYIGCTGEVESVCNENTCEFIQLDLEEPCQAISFGLTPCDKICFLYREPVVICDVLIFTLTDQNGVSTTDTLDSTSGCGNVFCIDGPEEAETYQYEFTHLDCNVQEVLTCTGTHEYYGCDVCPLILESSTKCDEICITVLSEGPCSEFTISMTGPNFQPVLPLPFIFTGLPAGEQELCMPVSYGPGSYAMQFTQTNCDGTFDICELEVTIDDICPPCENEIGTVELRCDTSEAPVVCIFVDDEAIEDDYQIIWSPPIPANQGQCFSFDDYAPGTTVTFILTSWPDDTCAIADTFTMAVPVCDNCDLLEPDVNLCCENGYMCVCDSDGNYLSGYGINWPNTNQQGQCVSFSEVGLLPGEPFTITVFPADQSVRCSWDYPFVMCGGEGRNFNHDLELPAKTKFSGLSIYPNPVNDRLQLTYPAGTALSYQILDAKGNVQWTDRLSENEKSLDLNQLAAGIYFIKFREKESDTWQAIKFVKL